MYNAVKTLLGLALISLISSCLVSCGSKSDPDKVAAQGLIEQINSLLESGDAMQAMALMDTVDKKYRGQIEERKIVKSLRPRAIETATIQQIAHADSLIAMAQVEIAQLEPLMKHIPGNDLEGYYVVEKAYNPDFIKSSAFEARVNDDNNMFYIVAVTNGKTIGVNQVALNGATGECRSESINSRANQGGVVEGSEIASFLPEEVDSLGRWAWNNTDAIREGIIYGSKGNVKFKISPQQAQAIATAWRFANQKQQERNGLILREKLDRRLQIARDQVAQSVLDIVE